MKLKLATWCGRAPAMTSFREGTNLVRESSPCICQAFANKLILWLEHVIFWLHIATTLLVLPSRGVHGLQTKLDQIYGPVQFSKIILVKTSYFSKSVSIQFGPSFTIIFWLVEFSFFGRNCYVEWDIGLRCERMKLAFNCNCFYFLALNAIIHHCEVLVIIIVPVRLSFLFYIISYIFDKLLSFLLHATITNPSCLQYFIS